MKALLKTEEALQFALAIYLNALLPFPGWYFWAWFLGPDIGILGYAAGPRVGAITYNLFHHKGVAVAIGAAGLYLSSPALQFAGLVLFGHSAFDRMLGYGLKHSDNFRHTHLGMIGRDRPE